MASSRIAWLVVFSCVWAACGDPASPGGGVPDPGPAPAFTIGGAVTGLHGTGLVLTNEGHDGLKIAGDGAFTFATPVDDGAAYAVEVATQPESPRQTCSVANGAGTVAGKNVDAVLVTCVSEKFSVGGALSGLAAGRSVTLRLNGGGDLVLHADGAFTFAALVEDGAGYTVSVAAQPAGQTCAVTNGIGAMQSADVSSVAVACSDNQYSVGGVVTGLAGSGLALRLNGAETLPVASDGGFTFATPLTYGAAYAVTVATQPSNLSQTCTAAYASGTINGNVGVVTVTCATDSFTVGGTVGNLLGSGLVLRINGGETQAVSADGAYAFATPLADGSAYAVTVATQPTGPDQACTVARATGSLAGANVGDVDVSCALAYAVGGTVSGLETSGGLVLSLNGGADVTVDADGAFAFAQKLGDGAAYNVTVKTQPQGPPLECVVGGGAGVIAAAAVTGVAVTCQGWRGAGLVESQAGTANGPQVAFLPGGDALAVWYQQDPSVYHVFSSRYYAAAGTWSTADRLDTATNTDAATSPRLGSDASGGLFVVWLQQTSGVSHVYARAYTTATAGWSLPALLDSQTGDAAYASVAVDASGDALAVWQQKSPTNRNDIWSAKYSSGGGWAAATLAETDDLGPAVLPTVAAMGGGDFLAAWHQSDGTRNNLTVNRNTALGGWGTAQAVDASDTGGAIFAEVAADGAGNAMVAFQQTVSLSPLRYDIDAAYYDAGLPGWSAAVTVDTSSDSATWADLAFAPSGDAVAVWRQADGTGNASVWTSRFSAGSWGAPALLGSGGYDPGTKYLELRFEASGEGMAVWHEYNGSTYNVVGNRYRGGAWLGKKTVRVDAGSPHLAVDPSGRYLAVWISASSIWFDVYR